MIRNHGLVVNEPFAARAREIDSPERLAARRSFEDAWNVGGVRDVQRRLAADGWPGVVINVPGPLVPPELAPLGISARADQTVHALFEPDGNGGTRPANDAARRIVRESAEREAAARERMANLNTHRGPDDGKHYPGDLSRTVG